MDTTTIKPGIGVGDLHLNASPEEILDILGEPDSKETSPDSDMWYYEALNLSVLFQPDEKWRVTEIDASDPGIRLGKVSIYDTLRDEAEAMLAKAGLSGGKWYMGLSEDVLKFEKEGLAFGFFEGLLEEVEVWLP